MGSSSRRARRLARAIAYALLAGAWTERAALDRLRKALGPPVYRPKSHDEHVLERYLARFSAAQLGEHPYFLHVRARIAASGRRRRGLVRALLTRFPTPPGDPERLVEAVLAEPFFVDAAGAHGGGIFRWYVPPVRMDPLWPVPAWARVGELAAALRLDPGMLAWLADTDGRARRAPPRLRHYHLRWVPKPTGGHRLLEIPKRQLAGLQRRLLHDVLDAVPPHPAAVAFRPGASPLRHAAAHAGAPTVLRMDLEDFFLTTRAGRVTRALRAAGYPAAVARTLAGLCTTVTAERTPPPGGDPSARARTAARLAARHLPQGAPTSPALANLCAWRLDVRLAALAAALDLRYTRYADDLAFSGAIPPAAARRLAVRVAAVAIEEGYAVNHRKTRVMPASQRQVLTGVVVNAHPNVPRAEYDRLKAILHNCVTRGPAANNRAAHPDFRAHLAGRIAWVRQCNPARAVRLQALFDRIAW